MYNKTTNILILGDRLKQIREHLNLSQIQIAELINCKQNAISNLETGKGSSVTVLINLLNYYSSYVYIDLIFSERFYLVSNVPGEDALKPNINSIIYEIIHQAVIKFSGNATIAFEDFEKDISRVKDMLDPHS